LKKIIPVIGYSLLALATVFFIWYEFMGGRAAVNYDQVAVLQKDVSPGEKIKDSTYFKPMKTEKSNIIEEAIYVCDENERRLGEKKCVSSFIGKTAEHFIPEDTQLHPYYFEDDNLVLDKDEFIAEIPKKWLNSFPQTLRRGDKVYIYSVKEEVPNKNSYKAQSQEESSLVEEGDSSEKDGVEETKEQTEKPIKRLKTTVAYVKDGSNQEVISVSKNGRLNGSSTIQSIEIVTTAEKFEEIEKDVRNGSKLVLMYNNSQIQQGGGEIK